MSAALEAWQSAATDSRLKRAERIVLAQVVRLGRPGNLDMLARECRLTRVRVEEALDHLREYGHLGPQTSAEVQADRERRRPRTEHQSTHNNAKDSRHDRNAA